MMLIYITWKIIIFALKLIIRFQYNQTKSCEGVVKKTKSFIKINSVGTLNGLCSTNIYTTFLWFYERKANIWESCHGHFWNFHEKSNQVTRQSVNIPHQEKECNCLLPSNNQTLMIYWYGILLCILIGDLQEIHVSDLRSIDMPFAELILSFQHHWCLEEKLFSDKWLESFSYIFFEM